MHYKRMAAVLKMVRRSKHRMEDILFNLVQDVYRHPDRYTFDDKLRLADRVDRFHWKKLKELECVLSSQGKLLANADALSKNAPESMSDIQRERTFPRVRVV